MYRKMVKQFMKKISKQEIQYDFCLICLWSHQVFVNPLYHFVRKALNSVTSEIIKEKLYSFNPNISINNKESSLLRYQIKYPCAPALLVLAAVLEKKYSVNVISLDVEKKKLNSDDWLTIAIREISKKTKYGIMISFVSTELTQLYNFTELIKKEKKELKIIVGGVHATYNDFQLMQNFNIDYIIRGEGELTTLELCDAIVTNKDVKNIQGITYRHNGKIIRNADRNFIDLKDTPIPAYHDLDMKNKTISVNKQVQRIKSELKATTPKTAASIRKISICDECLNQLIILRSRQRLNTKLIFPSPITNGYRDPSSITRKLHRMQKRAGVPQIRFHDLRHSFATLSLEQGMDIKTISHMLGHTDAGFTMNTYMHVTDSMQRTVANAMGNLVAEKENEKRIKIIQYTA